MPVHEKLLGKWHKCREKRYSVLVVIRAPADKLFSDTFIDQFAVIVHADILNFQEKYRGRLDYFYTWQNIRTQIYTTAKNKPVIVTNLEPIYAKWPISERLTFIKSMLKSEPQHTICMVLNCQEDLSELKAIEENSRGIIWVPA